MKKSQKEADIMQPGMNGLVKKHDRLEPKAFEKLRGLMRYANDDFSDGPALQAIQEEAGRSQRPACFYTIPAGAFGILVEHLSTA